VYRRVCCVPATDASRAALPACQSLRGGRRRRWREGPGGIVLLCGDVAPADGAPRSPPGPLRASGWTRQRWVGRARARFLRHSHVAVLFHGPASRAPRRVPWAGLGESREAHEQSTGNAQAQQTESGGEQALREDGGDELTVELKPRKLEFPGESNDRRAD